MDEHWHSSQFRCQKSLKECSPIVRLDNMGSLVLKVTIQAIHEPGIIAWLLIKNHDLYAVGLHMTPEGKQLRQAHNRTGKATRIQAMGEIEHHILQPTWTDVSHEIRDMELLG
jgi:hypothetical protein